MTTSDDEARCVAIRAKSSLEAHLAVAALRDAGIEATAVETSESIPSESRDASVPVWVHAADRTHAIAVLAEPIAVAWDDIDLGGRTDDLPLARPGRMPLPARIAFFVTLGVGIVGIAAAIAALFVA